MDDREFKLWCKVYIISLKENGHDTIAKSDAYDSVISLRKAEEKLKN